MDVRRTMGLMIEVWKYKSKKRSYHSIIINLNVWIKKRAQELNQELKDSQYL